MAWTSFTSACGAQGDELGLARVIAFIDAMDAARQRPPASSPARFFSRSTRPGPFFPGVLVLGQVAPKGLFVVEAEIHAAMAPVGEAEAVLHQQAGEVLHPAQLVIQCGVNR